MKSIRSRVIILLIALGVGVYLLLPTFQYGSLSDEETVLLSELSDASGIPLNRLATDIYRDDVDLGGEVQASNLSESDKLIALEKLNHLRGDFQHELKNTRHSAIKLGLDLQGGMYLVLEVDVLRLMKDAAQGKDEAFTKLTNELEDLTKSRNADVFQALGAIADRDKITLSRYWGDAGQDNPTVLQDLETAADDAIDRSLEILRNRVDQFGVSEPSISKLGTRRIALELPGVKDPERARDLVGRTALLEFKLLVDADRSRDVLTSLNDAIAKRNKGQEILDPATTDTTVTAAATDTTKTDTGAISADSLFAENDVTAPDTSDAANPLLSLLVGGTADILVPTANRSQVTRMLTARENHNLIPSDVQFLWSSKSQVTGTEGEEYWTLYLVKRTPEMTGSKLADAVSTIGSGYDPQSAGKPIVQIEFTKDGGRVFARVTGANEGKRLAIVLDDKVFMAPNLREKITGGSAIITGLENMEEARDISIILRAGALPAPVSIVEERTIGPSLGQDSVEAGRLCLLISFLSVTLFMIWYYRASGGIADLAMLLNVFLLMAVLALFQFTLTMPGIAGIILTIGMAVDANVLIFERIREELRLGKSVRAAIDAGFTRATVTILDSNITTAIAGVVLLIYGTGPIKGFALTLTVGIVINLFASIFLTRLMYDAFTQGRQLNTLSV